MSNGHDNECIGPGRYGVTAAPTHARRAPQGTARVYVGGWRYGSHMQNMRDRTKNQLALFDAPQWAQLVGIFDLETTGVDVTSDRIVSAHVGVLDGAGQVIQSNDWLANPGIPIPEGASAIHGISTTHAQTHGSDAGEVVRNIVAGLGALLDSNIPVVAYNAPFDFSILKHEALRHGVPPISEPSPVIDPLVLDKRYDRWRPGKRTLDVVAEHYRIRLAHAHQASGDAVAAGRVAQALARQYACWLPSTLSELHERQVRWARAQASSLTKHFIQIGRIAPDEHIDGTWPIR